MAYFLDPLMESKDAAELDLGDEFNNDTCLSNAEAAVILDKQKVNYVEQKKMFPRSLYAFRLWRLPC
ncbi:unnamed protein product [Phytophthora lilii]|uniref:Unnamed protein product n=1 Tax=Phytophthora lilii TaxID=2077276 RepID=A0A9W6TF86_9STRA|nr:unnamed protein product [Phytophthora lilii]